MLTLCLGLVSLPDRQARSTDVSIGGWILSLRDRQARSSHINIVWGGSGGPVSLRDRQAPSLILTLWWRGGCVSEGQTGS